MHALAATVWTGGHLVLDLGVLPRALREGRAAPIRAFEETFEPLGLTALAIQSACWWAPSCCCWSVPRLWPCMLASG